MENRERQNLRLTGDGMTGGGKYNNVSITGDGIINGSMDCISLNLVGTCDAKESIRTKKAKITGTSTVKENLEAENFELVGTIIIDGNSVVKELIAHGEFKVKGNMSVESAKITGVMDIEGDCSSDIFHVKGPFRIGGLLNAGDIEVELHCKCHVKEVGGEKINIKRGTDMAIKKVIKSIYLPQDFYQGELITDLVEGDDIYLEYTKAKIVRGNNIIIGPGCEIELIEYRNTCKQHEASSIGKSNKL